MAAGTRNSRFAVTCALLRRYIREHQLGGLAGAFRLPPPPLQATKGDGGTDARAMPLFHVRDDMRHMPYHQKEQTETKAAETLTILYEGQVLVFEDFPADKANELIELLVSASSSSPASAVPGATKGGGRGAVQSAHGQEGVVAALSRKEEAQDRQRYLQSLKEGDGRESRYRQRPEEYEPIASWLRL